MGGRASISARRECFVGGGMTGFVAASDIVHSKLLVLVGTIAHQDRGVCIPGQIQQHTLGLQEQRPPV